MRSNLAATFCILLLALAASTAHADGLLGTYYDQNGTPGAQFTGNTVQRLDAVIDHDWGNGAPVGGIGADDFTVRWTGDLLTTNWGGGNSTRDFDFRTRSDDGVRLYLDRNRDGDFNDAGELLINNWTDHAPTEDNAYGISLTRNTRYPIMLEYYERGGGAVIELYWNPPFNGNSFEIIPTTNLFANLPPEIDSVANGVNAGNPCGDPRTLIVTWNTAVQSGGGNGGDNAANFSVTGGPAVTGASLSGDGLTTTLTLAGDLYNGAVYDLVVSNVRSAAGTLISPNPTSHTFTATTGIFTNGGLAASYYPQPNFGGTPAERVDAQVDFAWGTGNPGITGFPVDGFSVRWEGFITLPNDYEDQLVVTSDEGFRLWIDGALYDRWTTGGEQILAANLTPGGTYPVRLEYHDDTGDAQIQFGYRYCAFNWGGCWYYAERVFETAQFSYCDRPIQLAGFLIGVAPGTASTCSPLSVSVAAQDGAGNTLTGWTGTVALETIPAGATHGDWSLVSGNGALNDTTADDGQATYSFVSTDNGAVTLALANEHADDLQIRVTDALTAVASQSGTISFRDNAFVIAGTDPPSLDDVPVVGRPHPVSVSMMRRETPGDPTSDCSAAAGYDGSRSLKAWITRDAVDPGGAAPGINATPLPNAQPAASNLALNFTDGVAALNLDTSDVGKYTLHLLDDTGTFANAVNIGGMSNTLTVRPFAISIRTAVSGAGPGDPVLAAAGAPFAANVVGVAWQAADDADNDGVPDDADGDNLPDDDLSDNATTPAFANEVQLSAVLHQPSGGTPGAFPNDTVPATIFAGGSATYPNFRYGEVGSIRLDAISSNYLGTAAADITGGSNPIGRFTPAYFETEVAVHGCDAAGFTYSGQPIAALNVIAYNAQGAITRNYSWTGSSATSFSRDIMLADANGVLSGSFTNGGINQDAFSEGDTCAGDCAGGGTSVLDDVIFTLDAKESGPGAITLRAEEYLGDGITSDGHTEGSTTIHSGRLRIMDRTVSSLTNADQAVLVESWQDLGGGSFDWDVNTLDTCTGNTVTIGNFTLDASGLGGTTSALGFMLDSGEGVLTLAAPGANNGGTVNVSINLVMSGASWLQYDWNQDGSAEDPAGVVNFFEIFETEQGFIDRREVVQ